jgi:hypothetical protein
VGMAYCSCSQPFPSSFPKHSPNPTMLVLYHKSAFSANLTTLPKGHAPATQAQRQARFGRQPISPPRSAQK